MSRRYFRRKIWAIFLLLFVVGTSLRAQTNFSLYNIKNLYQSTALNPSFISEEVGKTISLPSIALNTETPYFTLQKIFGQGVSNTQTLYLIRDDPRFKLEEMRINAQIDFFNYGKRYGQNYYSFGLSLVNDAYINIPRTYLDLLFGTTKMVGQNINLDNFAFNMSSYTQFAFGFAREANKRFTYGVKLKILSGAYNTYMKTFLLRQESTPSSNNVVPSFNYVLRYDYSSSGMNQFSHSPNNNNPISNYFSLPNGIAADFGITYWLKPKLKLSASIIDFGSIFWNRQLENYSQTNKGFLFNGVDINYSKSSPDYLQKLKDTLPKVFLPDTSHSSYSTPLNTKVYIGLQHLINNSTTLNVLFYGEYVNSFNAIYPAISLQLTKSIWNVFDIGLSWSYYNQRYDNMGASVVVNIKPIQIFVASDNVIGLFKYSTANQFNIKAGININLNRKKRPEFIDRFKPNPTLMDSINKLSLPDLDQDSVPDIYDKCPDTAGLKEFYGCPDSSGLTRPFLTRKRDTVETNPKYLLGERYYIPQQEQSPSEEKQKEVESISTIESQETEPSEQKQNKSPIKEESYLSPSSEKLKHTPK